MTSLIELADSNLLQTESRSSTPPHPVSPGSAISTFSTPSSESRLLSPHKSIDSFEPDTLELDTTFPITLAPHLKPFLKTAHVNDAYDSDRPFKRVRLVATSIMDNKTRNTDNSQKSERSSDDIDIVGQDQSRAEHDDTFLYPAHKPHTVPDTPRVRRMSDSHLTIKLPHNLPSSYHPHSHSRRRKSSHHVLHVKSQPSSPTHQRSNSTLEKRQQYIICLKNSLNNNESKANEIETYLYNKYGDTNNEYREKIRDLLYNLKNNNALLEHIINGSLPADRLVEMNYKDFAAPSVVAYREKAWQSDLKAHIATPNEPTGILNNDALVQEKKMDQPDEV